MIKKYCITLVMLITALHGWSQSVVSAEYYWDNDPGIGSATSLNVNTPGSSIDENFTISTSGLSQSEHLLCIRTMNNLGEWSTIENKSVHVHQFTSAEYFWDQDLGLGSGNALALNTTNTDVTNNYTISTVNVREGWHVLYTRVKGFEDSWSAVEASPVYIENEVAAAEYFWNQDPGVGNGTALDIGTASSDITFTDEVTTVGLDTTQDFHYLVARTMAQNGAWSVLIDTLIYLGPASVEDFVVGKFHNILYPNPARSSTTLSLFSVSRRDIYISLENMTGERLQQVYNGPVSGRKDLQLDLSSLSAGIYLMHYTTDHYEWTTKLIVE